MALSDSRLESTRPTTRWHVLATNRRSATIASSVTVGAALLIVVAPLYAWLLVLCAVQREPLSQVAAPVWFLLAEALVGWIVGRGLRGRSALALVGAAVVPVLVSDVLLLLFSPISTAANPASLSPNDPIYGMFLDMGVNPTSVGLLAIAVYVWWASASDGAQRPDVARAQRRFFLSVGATLGATIVILAAPDGFRATVTGQLAVLLAALVFTGLLSLTLTMLTVERQSPNVDPIFVRSQWRQITRAALVGGVVVLGALTIMLLASPEILTAIFARSGLAFLINQLLGLIRAILALLAIHSSPFHLTPDLTHGPPPPQGKLKPKHPTSLTLPPLAAYLSLVVAVLTLSALAYAITRALSMAGRRPRISTFEEERESLDGWRLLGAQLHAWLRRRAQTTADGEALGGVRALYRDLLRQAAGSGLARAPQQTPQEYATLLSASPPFSTHDAQYADDLRQLSDVYAEARYAEREPPAERLPALREQARRLRDLLGRRARR